jgi:hypothetical protein
MNSDTTTWRPGDKIQFKGVGPFWFNNMVENGKKLQKFEVYTIKTVKIASSWTGITLEETGDLEYSAGWFIPYEI